MIGIKIVPSKSNILSQCVSSTFLLVLTGCAVQEVDVSGAKVAGVTYRADDEAGEPAVEAWPVAVAEPQLSFDRSLTLREAIHRALRYSPSLQAAALEVEAKHGEAVQAAVRPNPQASLELENFGGTGNFDGFASAEETLAISQLIELGGKRYKRLAVAELDRDVSAWDYEARRLQVTRETAEAFIDVLATQQAITRSKEANRIARELERDVKARVDAGSVSPIEIQRTRPIVANTLVRLQAEQARLEPAKRRLASMWGASMLDFGRVAGRFSIRTELPPVDQILSDLAGNPQIARWSDEIARRGAFVALQFAKAVPDVTLGAGVRRLNDTDDTAIVASASVALPLFDRNAGNIQAAESRLAKADFERGATAASLRSVILQTYGDLAAAAAEVRALSGSVVPPARAAYRAVQTSYQAGESNLLAVLDARRVLFDAQLNLIDAQAKFEKAKVRIEGLIGRKI